MLKIKLSFLILIVVFGAALSCFAQNFEGTALSSAKPYYSKLPYVFEGSETYFITFKSNPNVIRALVPEPLQTISDEITFVFAEHKLISPAKIIYNEAYFIIPAAYGTTFGGYLPVLYLDKIETITPAREIWGYNKVGGDFKVEKKDNKISVRVSQLDTLLIKASFVLGDPIPPPKQQAVSSTFNLKFIPSVSKNAPPDVKQITISELKDRETEELRIGTAKLEFYSSHYNPLDKIAIMEIKQSGYSKISFSMVNGKVLYDYLKETK